MTTATASPLLTAPLGPTILRLAAPNMAALVVTMVTLIAGAWFIKIWLDFPDAHSFPTFIYALSSNQPMPKGVFWALFTLCYLTLAGLTAGSFLMKEKSGEFSSKAMRRKKWLK